MKIGVITFWTSKNNYGQILQCYALQKYLESLGHTAYIIKYNHALDSGTFSVGFLFRILNPKKIFLYFKKKKSSHFLKKNSFEDNRNFEEFKKKYIVFSECNYSSFEELKNHPPVADMYIAGSDQIWNNFFKDTKHSYNKLHAFFLDFGGKDIKRISYAASWGTSKIPKKSIKHLSELLSNFEYVSVREKTGVDICRLCGCNNVEWVCDPTMLLSAERYRKLYNDNDIRKPKSKFIFLYLLRNTSEFGVETVLEFAKFKNLDLIYVTGNGLVDNYEKFYATIPEWLYLIDNAEYVITNSYHCVVFSNIFYKKFGVIPLTDNYAGMNERFDSLFSQLEMNPRYLHKNDFSNLDKEYQKKNVYISERFSNFVKN